MRRVQYSTLPCCLISLVSVSSPFTFYGLWLPGVIFTIFVHTYRYRSFFPSACGFTHSPSRSLACLRFLRRHAHPRHLRVLWCGKNNARSCPALPREAPTYGCGGRKAVTPDISTVLLYYRGLLFLAIFLVDLVLPARHFATLAHNGQFSRGANLVCAVRRGTEFLSVVRVALGNPTVGRSTALAGLLLSLFARWRLRVCFSVTSVSRARRLLTHSSSSFFSSVLSPFPLFLPLRLPFLSPPIPHYRGTAPTSTASAGDILFTPTFFGKLVKRAFPGIKDMRKGPRGSAKQVRPPIPLHLRIPRRAALRCDISSAPSRCLYLSPTGVERWPYCFSFCLSTTCPFGWVVFLALHHDASLPHDLSPRAQPFSLSRPLPLPSKFAVCTSFISYIYILSYFWRFSVPIFVV